MLAVDSTSRLQSSSVVKSLSERRIFCEEKQGNVVHVKIQIVICNMSDWGIVVSLKLRCEGICSMLFAV